MSTWFGQQTTGVAKSRLKSISIIIIMAHNGPDQEFSKPASVYDDSDNLMTVEEAKGVCVRIVANGMKRSVNSSIKLNLNQSANVSLKPRMRCVF
jgi:hypothetical protein